MSRRVVLTDYWSGSHRPYQNILRDPRTDEVVGLHDAFEAAVRESGAVSGDEVEVVVRRTGRRPFGNRRVWLVKPHTYEREK